MHHRGTTYPCPLEKYFTSSLPRLKSRSAEVLQVNECRPSKHDSLEQQKTHAMNPVIPCNCLQEILQVQQRHVRVYIMYVAFEQFVTKSHIWDRQCALSRQIIDIFRLKPRRKSPYVVRQKATRRARGRERRIEQLLNGRCDVVKGNCSRNCGILGHSSSPLFFRIDSMSLGLIYGVLVSDGYQRQLVSSQIRTDQVRHMLPLINVYRALGRRRRSNIGKLAATPGSVPQDRTRVLGGLGWRFRIQVGSLQVAA